MTRTTIKQRYMDLGVRRHPFLERGRVFASLTIPALLPAAGFSYTQHMPEPYNEFGGRAVPHLSSKLVTAILPPGQTHFRLSVPPKTLLKSGMMSAPQDLEKGLVLAEQMIMGEIERAGWTHATALSIALLIVTGNSLEKMLPDNTLQIYRLDQYAVVRDGQGKLIEVILEDRLLPISLPDRAKMLVTPEQLRDTKNNVEMYTSYKLQQNGTWEVKQELNGAIVPGSVGRIVGPLPCIVNRWALVPGEDYGRGKVEEHISGFRQLEGYEKSMVDGAALASRHLTFVRPNATGGNLRQRIAKANNGAVLAANPEDVAMYQFQNVSGLQIVEKQIERVTRALSAAFLMMSELQRDAERVTAFELRQLAEELDGALGGTYSLLSQEMQKPRLNRLVFQMQSKGELPKWNDNMVSLKITTGLEAIGRSSDVQKVATAGELVKGIPGSEEYVKMPDLLKKGFNGLGLADCVRTDDEVKAMKEQQAALDALTQGGGQALGAMGKAAVDPQQPV
jgi:hypothetical protein